MIVNVNYYVDRGLNHQEKEPQQGSIHIRLACDMSVGHYLD